MSRRFVYTVLGLSLVFSPIIAPPVAADSATVSLGSHRIDWQPDADAAGWMLTVTGPQGFYYREVFADAPSMDIFTADGQLLADGLYNYELRAIPHVDPRLRRELEASEPQSGHFRIAQGVFVTDDLLEPPPAARDATVPTGDLAVSQTVPEEGSEDLQVFNVDVLVNGSLCVGFDCGSSQSFAFDTVRLRENNLRIHFDDTSSSSFFPNNDWRLVANDTANGGIGRFSIEDATAGRDVFTIEAGAPTNALYVDSVGRVGLGTSTPLFGLHLFANDTQVASSTPMIRLEQGFPPKAWDVGANQTHFFVREDGLALPFRILTGAPSDALVIQADGALSLAEPLPISEGGTGATNAADARANLGIEVDVTKAGILPASAFGGTPATATVTFAEPFPPSTSIVVMLTSVTSDPGKTVGVSLLSTSESGFTVTRSQAGGGGGGGGGAGGGPPGGPPAGGGDPLVEVQWLARPVGE